MGFGDLFLLLDSISRHRGIRFPGHRHANLYDVFTAGARGASASRPKGITVYSNKRITDSP